MATPPTLVAEYESAWNSSTSPKTVSVTVSTNDVLVIYGITADNTATLGTPSGGGLTYTQQQVVNVSSRTWLSIWTAIAGSGQTFTLSISRSGGTSIFWGFNCLRFSGSDGVGASASTNASSGAPTLNITTNSANSAIVVANGDWNAVDGTSRTWRTNAGTFTEQTYFRDSSQYTVYGGFHGDSGAVSTYAVGLSAPSGQAYTIGAVQVKGSTTSSQTIVCNNLSTSSTLYNPTVTVGSVTVVCNSLSTSSTIYSPAVSTTIACNSLSTTSTLYNPAIAVGSVTAVCNLLSVPSTLYNPTVTVGSVSVVCNILSVPSTVYDPTVAIGISNIVLDYVSAPSTLFNPTIIVGPVTVVVNLLSTTSTLYSPQIIQNIQIPTISTSSSLFDPTIIVGPVNIVVNLLNTTSTLYTPVVSLGGILIPFLNTSSIVYSPAIVNLLSIIQLTLVTTLSTIYSPVIVGGGGIVPTGSIADQARTLMLANRSLTEPRRETNPDLMGLVLADGTQTLVTKTDATTAIHLMRYMMSLR